MSDLPRLSVGLKRSYKGAKRRVTHGSSESGCCAWSPIYPTQSVSQPFLSLFRGVFQSVDFSQSHKSNLLLYLPSRDRERTMLTDGDRAGWWSSRVAGQILLHGRKWSSHFSCGRPLTDTPPRLASPNQAGFGNLPELFSIFYSSILCSAVISQASKCWMRSYLNFLFMEVFKIVIR